MSSNTVAFLQRYLEDIFQTDPVRAASLGRTEFLGQLPPSDADYLRECHNKMNGHLTEIAERIATADETTPRDELLDLRVAHTDASYRTILDARSPWWSTAPYVYVERIGAALTLAVGDQIPHDEQQAYVRQLLAEVPRYLAEAEKNLEPNEIAPLYLQLAREAADGLQAFISEDIEAVLAPDTQGMTSANSAMAEAAHVAIDTFSGWLESVQDEASGSWAAGADYFDSLLRDYYLLDIDSTAVHELGLEAMAQHRAATVEWANRIDSDEEWRNTVIAVSKRHSTRESLMDDYATHIAMSRKYTVDADLVTIPDGEEFQLGTVPGFQRNSIPMGVMNLAAPFSGSLKSRWLITPVAEGDEGHLRESCFAYLASISGHETYPGHHLQRVHHNLQTKSSPIRAYYTNSLFVEGWGLYVEDVLAESGFMDDNDTMLFKSRHALWRSARMVVDTGLHTQGWSFDQAVDFLVDEVALGRRMATGEVRRYVRHDDATYPSSYELGSRGFHRLRDRWADETGHKGVLKEFHDRVLSYGSVPLTLVEGETSWK